MTRPCNQPGGTRLAATAHPRPLVGACVLVAAALLIALPLPGETNTNFAITHGPFLQAPSETGITICWATSHKSVSWVEYRPESSAQWLTNFPAHHGLVDADVTIHNVPLTGLTPGTHYLYRAVSKQIPWFAPYKVRFGPTVATPTYGFTTFDPAKPATAFIAVNDRHDKAGPLTASLASVKWGEVDLAFLNGDMVDAVKDEAQLYRSVADPCVAQFATHIPFVYIRGNHDTRGSFARQLLNYFPTRSGTYYYTMQQGPVMFLVLDSGEDKGDANVEYSGLVAFEAYLRQQLEWLARQIEQPAFRQAPFRVCLMHIPPVNRPNPKFIRPRWLQGHVVPLLNRGKVDLLLCGHTHRYAIHPAGQDGLNFPMITGGAEMVIRGDATREQLRLTATDLSGKPLPQPPVITARQ